MRVVGQSGIIDDEWQIVADDAPAWPRQALVSLARWQRDCAQAEAGHYGVVVTPDDPLATVLAASTRVALLAIAFASFTDGRGYSLARVLRDSGYGGDLRAIGDVLPDQALFLMRCGFTSLAPAAHVDAAQFQRAFTEISHIYQAAADRRVPIRRLRGAH